MLTSQNTLALVILLNRNEDALSLLKVLLYFSPYFLLSKKTLNFNLILSVRTYCYQEGFKESK